MVNLCPNVLIILITVALHVCKSQMTFLIEASK